MLIQAVNGTTPEHAICGTPGLTTEPEAELRAGTGVGGLILSSNAALDYPSSPSNLVHSTIIGGCPEPTPLIPGAIGDLIVSAVLELVWPSTLLRLVSCSKRLLRSLTHETVIKSVLLRGGASARSRESLGHVIRLAREGRIFAPSPLRLLRLCCGKFCERLSCGAAANIVRPDYGVFYCWGCTTSNTFEFKTNTLKYDVLFSPPRLAF